MSRTRIIETAIDKSGNSYIYSNKEQEGWDLLGHTITDIFFSNQCPPNLLETTHEIKDKNFNLKPGQIRFFRSDIYPTKLTYNNMPNDDKPQDFKRLFYHSTTTIDYVVVTKGELVMIVANDETILRVGDVVIQRGAAHAWHNYTDEVATIIGIMIGVNVPSQFKLVNTVQPN